MLPLPSPVLAILRSLIRFFTRGKYVPQNPINEFSLDLERPLIYVIPSKSIADLLTLQLACEKLGLPDPLEPVMFAGQAHPRVAYLVDQDGETRQDTVQQFSEALAIHQQDESHDALLIPVKLFWDRYPGREHVDDLMGGKAIKPPSVLRRTYEVIFKGRESLVRFSQPVSLKQMAQRQAGDQRHGHNQRLGHKLARVARIHFSRMQHIATGPKLPNRRRLFEQLLASPVLRQAIKDEASSKNISEHEAKAVALSYLQEIAADFSYKTVRFADGMLSWVWNKIYAGIEVNHAERIRQLAQEGHEIVYAPCHRSHMDYLVLSYVLYHQGMVPPHIAAGVNLNFWPAGPFFRRSGAFFIRRSFKGNKLYSIVFREYLSQLFEKGYSVEYFSEGGRSRTGRLLPPKTGMLAMTIQAMRNMDRPVSIVPIYFGYEHVMEVGTYYKELKGKQKQKESAWSLVCMLRKLRNFGHGYVNFGEPILVNQRLAEIAPDWREHSEQEKPAWLVPAVNQIADELMVKINQATAVNSLCLCATVLLASDKKALPRRQLVKQLELMLHLLKEVPYSTNTTLPEDEPEALLEQAISLDKFELSEDSVGSIVGLDEKQRVLLSFYRNNIIHLLVLPAFIATALLRLRQADTAKITGLLKQLYPLLQGELFMHYSLEQLDDLVEQYLAILEQRKLIEATEDGYKVNTQRRGRLLLLAHPVQESLHRYAIMLAILAKRPSLERKEMEALGLAGAQRIASLHNVDAPEYHDKRMMGNLLSLLKSQGYEQEQEASALLAQLSQLLSASVLESVNELLDV